MHFKTTNKRWVSSNQFTTLPFREMKSFLVFVVIRPIIQQMSSSCGYRSLPHVRATHNIDQNSQSFQITEFTISLFAKRCFYGSFYERHYWCVFSICLVYLIPGRWGRNVDAWLIELCVETWGRTPGFIALLLNKIPLLFIPPILAFNNALLFPSCENWDDMLCWE